MSSLRNSIQRRSHRERGQLKERERFGLLEKNKDYKLRAKDHKKKQTVLKSLKQKAAERNEDEFYFGMVARQHKFSASALAAASTEKHNRRWTGTVAADRGNAALDLDTVRLLKTQDIGYLRTVRNVAAKEVRDLEERAVVAGAFAGVDVHGADLEEEDSDLDSEEDEDEDGGAHRRGSKSRVKPKKIVFADSVGEVEQILPNQHDDDSDVVMDSEGEDDDDEGLGPSNEKKKKAALEARKRRENAERLLRKLRTARKKLKALTAAENELELQRAKMAKTATVGGVTKSGRKIKIRERKR